MTTATRKKTGERETLTVYEAGRLNAALRDSLAHNSRFCDAITSETAEDVADMLHVIRDEPDGYADRSILRSTLEAVSAHLSGAAAGAVGGFYRAAAYAIRAARYIEYRRAGAGKGDHHGND